MEAHGTTLEVLGKTKEGEISSETFNKTGCQKYQCILHYHFWHIKFNVKPKSLNLYNIISIYWI